MKLGWRKHSKEGFGLQATSSVGRFTEIRAFYWIGQRGQGQTHIRTHRYPTDVVQLDVGEESHLLIGPCQPFMCPKVIPVITMV